MSILTPSVTSSWFKRVRITAYVLCFLRRAHKTAQTRALEPKEMHEASLMQAKLAQKHDDIKDTNRDLKDVDPYMGEHGELRTQGRLEYIKKLGLGTVRPLILKGS